ncbi:MAG: hypothetical protein P4L40_04805, partial [Terracidiphilus sp.]|nr:hypothetical protein [Terracidiphilus sp.]
VNGFLRLRAANKSTESSCVFIETWKGRIYNMDQWQRLLHREPRNITPLDPLLSTQCFPWPLLPVRVVAGGVILACSTQQDKVKKLVHRPHHK